MTDFSKWMKYVVRDGEPIGRHIFYRLKDFDIKDAEKLLGNKFPYELDMFYKQVGYGFLCCDNNDAVDRIMDPLAVAHIVCQSASCNYMREEYKTLGLLPFFELGDDLYITISVKTGGIFYFGRKVADSLTDFLDSMDRETDYYERGDKDETRRI